MRFALIVVGASLKCRHYANDRGYFGCMALRRRAWSRCRRSLSDGISLEAAGARFRPPIGGRSPRRRAVGAIPKSPPNCCRACMRAAKLRHRLPPWRKAQAWGKKASRSWSPPRLAHHARPMGRVSTPGQFSRWKHLRRSHFASGGEIGAHVEALRDEWARR